MLLVSSSVLWITACADEDETTGGITITVVDRYGVPIVGEAVYLAKSIGALSDGNYYGIYYTDAEGKVKIVELPPHYYWYDTEHYDIYGAAQVHAGIMTFVTLYVVE